MKPDKEKLTYLFKITGMILTDTKEAHAKTLRCLDGKVIRLSEQLWGRVLVHQCVECFKS